MPLFPALRGSDADCAKSAMQVIGIETSRAIFFIRSIIAQLREEVEIAPMRSVADCRYLVSSSLPFHTCEWQSSKLRSAAGESSVVGYHPTRMDHQGLSRVISPDPNL